MTLEYMKLRRATSTISQPVASKNVHSMQPTSTLIEKSPVNLPGNVLPSSPKITPTASSTPIHISSFVPYSSTTPFPTGPTGQPMDDKTRIIRPVVILIASILGIVLLVSLYLFRRKLLRRRNERSRQDLETAQRGSNPVIPLGGLFGGKSELEGGEDKVNATEAHTGHSTVANFAQPEVVLSSNIGRADAMEPSEGLDNQESMELEEEEEEEEEEAEAPWYHGAGSTNVEGDPTWLDPPVIVESERGASTSNRSTTTVMSDPPPPYAPVDPEGFDISRLVNIGE